MNSTELIICEWHDQQYIQKNKTVLSIAVQPNGGEAFKDFDGKGTAEIHTSEKELFYDMATMPILVVAKLYTDEGWKEYTGGPPTTGLPGMSAPGQISAEGLKGAEEGKVLQNIAELPPSIFHGKIEEYLSKTLIDSMHRIDEIANPKLSDGVKYTAVDMTNNPEEFEALLRENKFNGIKQIMLEEERRFTIQTKIRKYLESLEQMKSEFHFTHMSLVVRMYF